MSTNDKIVIRIVVDRITEVPCSRRATGELQGQGRCRDEQSFKTQERVRTETPQAVIGLRAGTQVVYF
jgi:hypothetical protein